MMNEMIRVEVAYAMPESQTLLTLEIETGSSVEAAIMQSGILRQYPEIDLSQQMVGIFSKLCRLQDIVQSGDRIEIYRPLIADPKAMRRARAQKEKASA